jgi:hypothetical protein
MMREKEREWEREREEERERERRIECCQQSPIKATQRAASLDTAISFQCPTDINPDFFCCFISTESLQAET